MRKMLVMASLVLSVLFLFACTNSDSGNKTNQSKGNDGDSAENESGKKQYPFTGEYTENDISNRAVAIMVSNQTQARPQSGLQEADIIFEFLTEGNLTRYLALYHSQTPDKVGPVRSAREYFFTLADNYHALYMYQGAANIVNEMIEERGIEHIQGLHYDNDGIVFSREDFRESPHNSYILFDGIKETAEEKGYEMTYNHPPLTFAEEGSSFDGEDANYAKIDYYGGTPVMEFFYGEETKKYTQTVDGDQTRDLDTDEAISVDNVFIVETDHEVIDKQQRRRIDISSGGDAYLLRQGKVEEVEWENQDGYIVPVKDGDVIPFATGKTWVSFVQTEPETGVTEQVIIEQIE